MNEIKLGYETNTGTEIDIPIFHTVVTGITRHGKSETMNALAQRAHDQGYTILIFDVKNPRDYGGFGQDIPIYLEEHTDPTTLKRLLENQSGMGLSFQFSELIKMYEPGDTYHDMLERMTEAMDEDVHPVEEDKLRVLVHLLQNLTEELDRVEISDALELQPNEINVMDLHAVDDSIQQLAIAGSVKQVLDEHQDVIIILDEAHNFIPQRKQPPARESLVKAIREGAANNNWLWISDQTITGVDKDPLKQVGVWILGKQREKNEAKRVLDQIPGSTSYGSDDVMTLDTGHFIVALDDAQPLVYVQPVWMDDLTAEQIATHDAFLENHPGPSESEEPDMDETIQQKDQELQERENRIRELEDELAAKQREIEALEDKIDTLFDPDAEQPSEPASVEFDDKKVREIVEDYIEEYEVPDAIRVDREQPRIEIYNKVEPVQASTDEADPIGVLVYMYATGEIDATKARFSGGWESELAEHGYSITLKRTGILGELCRMGLMKKHANNKYSWTMTPQEAKDRGLVEIEEVVA